MNPFSKLSRRALVKLGLASAGLPLASPIIGSMSVAEAKASASFSRDRAQGAIATGDQWESGGGSVSLDPGVQVHYRADWLGEPWRTPETALLIHGNLESGEVWYGWVPGMGQQFRLLRPDLPGFGLSSAPADFDWSLGNFAKVMANFLDRLGVSSAHIIGAKTGGAIAMQFAATYPQKTKSLAVASGPFAPVDPKFENSPQRVRLGSAATEEEIAYFDKLRAATSRTTRAGMAKLLSGVSLESLLPNIQAPTLVITSDHSALQTVESVVQYQSKIPHSRLLVLTSDAYHVAVANAEECVRSILAFIHTTRQAG